MNKGYFKEQEPRLDIVAFFNDMTLAIMFDGIERNGMATLLYFVISHCAIRCYLFWDKLKQYQCSTQVG